MYTCMLKHTHTHTHTEVYLIFRNGVEGYVKGCHTYDWQGSGPGTLDSGWGRSLYPSTTDITIAAANGRQMDWKRLKADASSAIDH